MNGGPIVESVLRRRLARAIRERASDFRESDPTLTDEEVVQHLKDEIRRALDAFNKVGLH